MRQALRSFLDGFGSVLSIWPPPCRHSIADKYLARSIEEDFLADMTNVAADMNAAFAKALREVPHVQSGGSRPDDRSFRNAAGRGNQSALNA